MVDSPKRWKLIKISREKLHGLQTVTVYCVFVLCAVWHSCCRIWSHTVCMNT